MHLISDVSTKHKEMGIRVKSLIHMSGHLETIDLIMLLYRNKDITHSKQYTLHPELLSLFFFPHQKNCQAPLLGCPNASIYSSSQPGMFAVASFTIFTRVTTLSGTPRGGKERFLGGGPRRYVLLSNLHSPIFP